MIQHSRVSGKANNLKYVVLAATVALGVGEVFAQQGNPSRTPAVGDLAPDFSLQSVDGRRVTLSKLTEESPVVLIVLRGYPGYQCPICSTQVGSLINRAKDFAEAGAEVVFVYPGPSDRLSERAAEFLKAKSLPAHFVFLTDPDYKFTEQYGLRWTAPRETAYPSTFVIDRQGAVRFAKISKTHGDRAVAADILQAVTVKP